MLTLKSFEATFGGPEQCVKVTEPAVSRAAQELPQEIVEHWSDRGLCTYGNGLLHFVDPQQFDGVLEQWLDPKPERARVFLRTAFADLYFWDDGYVHALDVHYGRVSQVTRNLDRFFNQILCDPRVQDQSLRRKLYDDVVQRLGPPSADECYAFVPALALGGPGTPESVQKVKMSEHLDILRQLVVQ